MNSLLNLALLFKEQPTIVGSNSIFEVFDIQFLHHFLCQLSSPI